MQNYSKGHIDIYRDYEDFYSKLTDKADRIHNAISLVTKYVSHKDVSMRLESIGVDFLEMSYMLHPTFGEEHREIASQLSFTLKELKTITTGMVIKGTLNQDSKNLFDRELDAYIEILNDYVEHHARIHEQRQDSIISPLFTEEFFGDNLKAHFSLPTQSENMPSPQSLRSLPSETNKKDQTISQTKSTPKETTDKSKDMSFNKNIEEVSQGHTATSTPSQGHVLEKKKTDVVDRLNRKTSILNFIKQNKEAQIKDIMIHLGNCSEKTIQRELGELIKDGVLKKEGDRRWSRYSLLKDIRS